MCIRDSVDGGVPNMRLIVPELNEYYLGEIIYFFEKACGISGYLLGVNPFNQPDVYKRQFRLFRLIISCSLSSNTFILLKH